MRPIAMASASAMICTLLLATVCRAQDSTKKAWPALTLSGDAYYRSDFGGSSQNNKTSFTNSNNSLELGMFSVRLDDTLGKVNATVDLGYGTRANEFSYNDVGSLRIIKQAYISFAPSAKIKFTAGKWATHIGYEAADAYSNRNYSMDYMYSYGPFFHTGLKAEMPLGKKSAFMLGISNPCDLTTTAITTKALIAQFSTATRNDKLKLYLNFMGYGGAGTVQRPTPYYTLYKRLFQFDAVANYTASDKLGLGYNGTLQTVNDGTAKSWNGNALYINYDPVKKFGLTLRGEYFDDDRGIKIDGGAKIMDFTLSGNIRLDSKLRLIPELRTDHSDKKTFVAKGSPSNNAGSFLLAAVYKF